MAYLTLGLCLCLLGFTEALGGRRVGGISQNAQPVDQEIRDLVDRVKGDIVAQLPLNDGTIFEPISYKTQLVNGINYFVKIKIGANSYIHVKIYSNFMKTEVSLTGLELGKTAEDAINYI
ncbi:cystatin-A-like [Saccostrea echinata]|uniref:cystatin-A-like n=1 Tax=Saccostrea echinata TaxID=191078 RepID=UPI002A81B4B2|nr:cystatin-A-like [Saccostrea echinata]